MAEMPDAPVSAETTQPPSPQAGTYLDSDTHSSLQLTQPN
jgi:hypothetical protein